LKQLTATSWPSPLLRRYGRVQRTSPHSTGRRQAMEGQARVTRNGPGARCPAPVAVLRARAEAVPVTLLDMQREEPGRAWPGSVNGRLSASAFKALAEPSLHVVSHPDRTGNGRMIGYQRMCRACQMTDPPPSQTCRGGRDHYVGRVAGCPVRGRLRAVCARRRCSVMRGARWTARVARVRLEGPRWVRRRAWRKPGPQFCAA